MLPKMYFYLRNVTCICFSSVNFIINIHSKFLKLMITKLQGITVNI